MDLVLGKNLLVYCVFLSNESTTYAIKTMVDKYATASQ